MKNKLIFFLGLAIPSLFVFKSIMLPGPLAFGDAPYFYPEGLKLFMQKPLAWWNVGQGLGGINLLVWISPLMYLYALLGKSLSLGNDVAVRLVFYFPTIIFSFLTPVIFSKYFKFSKTVQFFGSLVYGLNTYFILLIDGGQVGVALAYSMFPYVLLSLYKFTEKLNITNFLKTLFVSCALVLIDPRIAIIAFVTIFVWKPKKIFQLFLLGLALTPLNFFWLFPLYKNGGGNLSLEVSSLQLNSLVNSLFLYQPHWPSNIYGQITCPSFYFVLIPILVFAGFLFKKDKNAKLLKSFGLLFLAFAFLAKGETPPFGEIYAFVLQKIPLGSTLRDSSKFFIPLLLFGGILIGNTIDKIKNNLYKVVFYAFLLLLIVPALLGKLNFVLSKRTQSSDYQKIYKQIQSSPGKYKTLWFPEKPTLGFESSDIGAVSAKNLADLRPIASITAGSSDLYNFLGQPVSSDWLRILGIKYMFFPGDTRKLDLSDEETDAWNRLSDNVSTNSSFKKLDWDTQMSIYEVVDSKPSTFEVYKMLAIVGGEDIYEKENIDPTITGTIFLEDGVSDANNMLKFPNNSLKLVYNEKDKLDLRFAFLKENFLNQSDLAKVGWAKYGPDEYLLWKYQLLIRGVQTQEHDYQKGILLSTKKDEKVEYVANIKNRGKFVVGVRGMGYENNLLSVSVHNIEKEVIQKEGSFGWQYFEVDLEKGKQKIVLTNKSGMQIINTIAIIPTGEWVQSEEKQKEFNTKFGQTKKIDNSQSWIIYSQNYHHLFRMGCGNTQVEPVPVYSMINGFWAEGCDDVGEIYFEGQKYIDLGIKISVVSFILLLIGFIAVRIKSS